MLATIYERWAVQVKDGHLPLWFPEFAGGGYPVHAAWMYGLFYPPIALFLALPPETAWTWLAILHIVFGALGMYAFLWDERRDVAAAASGAIVFALSAFMIGRIVAGHINLVMPLAWAPWVLRAAVQTARGERRALGWLVLTTSAGMLAGHVQIWFYVAPVVVAYAVMTARAAGRLAVAWRPLLVAAALIVGVTAIQWIPAWELFDVSGHPPEDRAVVLGCSAPGAALVAQLAPRLWTSDEAFAHEFSGLGGPLAVAAVLFAFRLRDPKRWFWFAVLLLGLVLAMGLRNPVSEFANDLPPFRWARAPGRAMALVVLAGGVLAGHAVADAVSSAARWRRFVPAAFVASALAVGVPWIGVVKSDFYDFDWARPLGAAASRHRVHVLGGRYPYLERFGIRTLRDVCPLDTPGYKALSKNPSPATAWWFDVGAEIELPWNGPPADLAATKALAERSSVQTFEGSGGAVFLREAKRLESQGDVLAAIRSGERAVWVDECWDESELQNRGDRPSAATHRVVRQPVSSPMSLSFTVEPSESGWLLISEKWYPGWKYHVDSLGWKPVPRGNLAFIAIPGWRFVAIEYRPDWLRRTLAVSLISLLTAIVIVVRRPHPR